MVGFSLGLAPHNISHLNGMDIFGYKGYPESIDFLDSGLLVRSTIIGIVSVTSLVFVPIFIFR